MPIPTKVLAIAGLGLCAYVAYRLRDMLSPEDEREMFRTLEAIDEVDPDLDMVSRQGSQEAGVEWGRAKRARYLAACVSREARAKFQPRIRTVATEMVLHKWMYDRLMEHKHIRKSDVARIVAYAVDMVWIPSDYEVQVRRETAADARNRRLAQYGRAWWSWHWWRGFSRVPVASPSG